MGGAQTPRPVSQISPPPIFSSSTTPYLHPHPHHPPQTPYRYPLQLPRRNNAKLIGLASIALFVVALLVVVGVQMHSSRTVTAGGLSKSAPVAAVCQQDSYRRPSEKSMALLRGTTDSALCTSRISIFPDAEIDSERYGAIWILQYQSLSAAQQRAAIIGLMGATTIGTIGGAAVLFYATADWTGASLAPLRQFGFAITSSR